MKQGTKEPIKMSRRLGYISERSRFYYPERGEKRKERENRRQLPITSRKGDVKKKL